MSAPKPTRSDYDDLEFWLWACVHSGEQFLKQTHQEQMATSGPIQPPDRGLMAVNPRAAIEKLQLAHIEHMNEFKRGMQFNRLAAYNFVMSIGSLIVVLNQAKRLYPELVAVIKAAEHTTENGRALRNKLEHAREYRDLPHAQQVDKGFISVDDDGSGAADATSLMVDDAGHWLGNRLNVQRALNEIRAIAEAFRTLPTPTP